MSAARPLIAVFDLVTSVGGVQTVMADLLPRLTDRFRIAVVDAYQHPGYRRLLEGAPVDHVALGFPPDRRYVGEKGRAGRLVRLAVRAPWLVSTGLRFRGWVRRHRPSVVYFNQLAAVSFFSRFVPRPGPEIVFHAHGFAAASDIRNGRYLGQRCARVVAVSRAVAAVLAQASVDPARITVIHNGIDTASFRAKARLRSAPLPPRSPGEIVVAHAAVLARNKQQDVAIEALARLPPNVVLWICGGVAEGSDQAYPSRLRALVTKLRLEERVHFLGWRSDVAAVLASADIAILPSAHESFGMVLAEAMALEKPCVGTAAGGIPEIIEDGVTGWVVEHAPQALADALAKLAASSDVRAAMGEAGRCRVERLFSAGTQALRIGDVLTAAAAAAWGGAGGDRSAGAAPEDPARGGLGG